MMNYKLNANHIFVQEDDLMKIISFADDEFSPSKFLILQKAAASNESERAMSVDKIHIQIEDESRSSYGGISAVRLSGENLVLSLDQEARPALQIEGDVEIGVDRSHHNFESAVLELKRMCQSDGVEFSL